MPITLKREKLGTNKSYLQHNAEENDGDDHEDQSVDEPSQPVHTIPQPHDLHHLLQTHLLLIHNSLHNHRHRVDPRDHHEQWQALGDGEHKPVKLKGAQY